MTVVRNFKLVEPSATNCSLIATVACSYFGQPSIAIVLLKVKAASSIILLVEVLGFDHFSLC